MASQTLEDYALRYTAKSARKTSFRVGNTAFGPIAFLACEAIGGAITLSYGFTNAALAILLFGVLMFAIGWPISVYAARYGVDIDLLTRGAGFGYIGSTITSLIYASFTFLLFAIEASIMSTALTLLFGIPIAIAHLASALVVIPIALYGISLISRVQLLTQPVWLVLQFLPLAYIAWRNPQEIAGWMAFAGAHGTGGGHVDLLLVGAAASVLLSLLPQIGEQVDYLRFMPERREGNRVAWWLAVIGAGPGWVVPGGLKLLAGSLLGWMLLMHGAPPAQLEDPTAMYHFAFSGLFTSPTVAVLITGLFVIVCQVKINVTNAYAGSIAWSNFFSRVTHTHPGRVVWLVFNVLLALLLMELGIFRAIETVLAIYANFAAGWIGALTADLVVNKPLGWSPRGIEFKRAHLYDVNPVGVGALAVSVLLSSLAYLGFLGEVLQLLSPFVALASAFVAAPAIARWTRGRYYLARTPAPAVGADGHRQCCLCENQFDEEDMALCPAYAGPICSLCCSLDARCRDQCKPEGRFSAQTAAWVQKALPPRLAGFARSRAGLFIGLLLVSNLAIGLVLGIIHTEVGNGRDAAVRAATASTLWMVFFCFVVFSCIAIWGLLLALENRRTAESESARQTAMLMEEIEAHKRTDAALQRAKEAAESANVAKSRYIVGLSHEIRAPLNSIYGYAQLLERPGVTSPANAAHVIRRSSEHLASLIDGLLDISRIEGGMLQLNRDRLALIEFIDQLAAMFRLQAAGKGIDFTCEKPQHLPAFVHTDERRLRQILINLLSNAVKYTERGAASLTVRYRNQVAEFEVADTGLGIAPEDLERIFQPFERGGNEKVRAIPGTGLGLTITRLLTQIMGGDLAVRSTPGVGTVFTVRLLLSEALHDVAAENPRHIRGYAGPKRRILLIDDTPAHADLMEGLLLPLGFEVDRAPDGASGLAAAAARMPHAVLVDISMPDMTGWQVIEGLRTMPGGERLRIIIVSANAHEYAPGGSKALHDAFVMKPVDLDVLLGVLQTQLRLEWVYRSDAATGRGNEPDALDAEAVAGMRRHADDLWQLGLIGHVRGIQARLRELKAQEPGLLPMLQRLMDRVERFDMKGYMAALRLIREHD